MAKSPRGRNREPSGGISALAVVSGLLAAGFLGVIVWLWWADRSERLARQQAAPETAAVVLPLPAGSAEPEPQPEAEPRSLSTAPAAERGSESTSPAPAGPPPPEETVAATAAGAESDDAAAPPAPPPAPPLPAASEAEPGATDETPAVKTETTEEAARSAAAGTGEEAESPAAAETADEQEPSATAALVPPRTAVPPRTPAPPEEDRVVLAPAPDPGLILETEKGRLPIIGADGRRPWQVYRRPFAAPAGEPRLAVIIGDMGLSESATNAAIQQTPGPVTLAFAPYAQNLDNWIAQARAAGHEVMLQLPMEPYDYPSNDPGPHALLTSLSAGSNLERLEWLLGRFVGYVGVTNYMGSKFTASADDVEPVLEALNARGLLFIDARASGNSVAWRLAQRIGMPQAVNDRYLDNVASRTAIDARLEELEQIARSRGAALGIGFPYPVTLERVARWAPTLKAKGVHLAPASAVVDSAVTE